MKTWRVAQVDQFDQAWLKVDLGSKFFLFFLWAEKKYVLFRTGSFAPQLRSFMCIFYVPYLFTKPLISLKLSHTWLPSFDGDFYIELHSWFQWKLPSYCVPSIFFYPSRTYWTAPRAPSEIRCTSSPQLVSKSIFLHLFFGTLTLFISLVLRL